MARPIQATPQLSVEDSYKFLVSLKENENKKQVISFKPIDSKVKEKIINEGPKW